MKRVYNGYIMADKNGHITKQPNLKRAMQYLFINAISQKRTINYSEVNF